MADSSSSDQNANAGSTQVSNPSPAQDSSVPSDGRTATGANVGAPAAPASGSPTQGSDQPADSAAIQNQTNPNAGTGAQVIGTVPDRATYNQLLSTLLSDLEAILTRVQGFGNTFDTSKIQDSIVAARDETASELGLEKSDLGWVAPGSSAASSTAGGVNQPAATSGATDAQQKASDSSSGSSSDSSQKATSSNPSSSTTSGSPDSSSAPSDSKNIPVDDQSEDQAEDDAEDSSESTTSGSSSTSAPGKTSS